MKRSCPSLVMVIDDDDAIRESIVEVLEDHNYQTLEATNGKEAMERLHRAPERPCAILLDLMMPVMDGRTFHSLLVQDAELGSIPVVVVSATGNLSGATHGMPVSATLGKPVRLDKLLGIVGKLCQPVAGA